MLFGAIVDKVGAVPPCQANVAPDQVVVTEKAEAGLLMCNTYVDARYVPVGPLIRLIVGSTYEEIAAENAAEFPAVPPVTVNVKGSSALTVGTVAKDIITAALTPAARPLVEINARLPL